jgi:hypothetical protein
MRNIFYLAVLLFIAACIEPEEKENPKADLVGIELDRNIQHSRVLLEDLFGRVQRAYREDPVTVKPYFDRIRLVNTLANELRKMIGEKKKMMESGRAMGEGDWKELDKKFMVLKEKTLKNVKNRDLHSEHTEEVTDRALSHLYPRKDWIKDGAFSRTPFEINFYLDLLVSNLYDAEMEIGIAMFNDMYGGKYIAPTFMLAALPQKAEVKAGEESKVEFFLQAVAEAYDPHFIVGRYDLQSDSIMYVDTDAAIEYKKGKGILTINDRRQGEQEVQVIAVLTDPSTGKKTHVPLTYKYKVVK